MPVQKIWSVDHACGHSIDVDLSERPADRRAGYARWLASRDCSECWRASKDADSESKAEWLANKRADEAEAAETWAEQYRMPSLDGSERAVGWASRCRHQLVTAAYTALVTEGGMDESEWQAIEEAVRPLTRAGWWIDNREADPSDLPELLEAASGTDRPTENPRL
ncbi:hypothetical protein [Streptomyces sp. AA1529]|uniref:hypothetical protein n=1 Tax=Streptomyces sp. AA1529 TaxID=1203257 RepID=UPI0002DEE2D1|nr:hypothetical protein [Streptomyces sp. AA1529]